jgi:hypothetical protein
MKYRNQHWGFEIDLPLGWTEPNFFRRLLSFGRYAKQSVHPGFYACDGSSLKIAIGPISLVPSAEQQRMNLEVIAHRHGHEVIETGTIDLGGKIHATMVCRIPGVGIIKNYSLIFGTTEYFVTAQGNWQDCDSIVKTFKIVSSQNDNVLFSQF